MAASFPPMVARIVGETNLRELIRVQDTHLIPCAQSHVTSISTPNFPHICVPENTYAQYNNEAYPRTLDNPGIWDGEEKKTPVGRQAAKAILDGEHTDFSDT